MATATLLAHAAMGCFSEAPLTEDAVDDAFLGGKGDSTSIDEGGPDALGVLRVVNELSASDLENDVGLSSRPANNIAAHRLGPDGIAGTPDDDPFDDLAELDAVRYVGTTAFGQILRYALANGFVEPEVVEGDGTLRFDEPLSVDLTGDTTFLTFDPAPGDVVYFRVQGDTPQVRCTVVTPVEIVGEHVTRLAGKVWGETTLAYRALPRSVAGGTLRPTPCS